MAKIKEIIANQKSEIKNIFQRYAVTLAAANLCCILYVILDLADYNWHETKAGAYMLYILMGLSIGSFLLESVLTEDGRGRKKRIIPYTIVGIISFIFTWTGDIFFPDFSDKGKALFFKILALCIILCVGLGLYAIIRKSGMCFQKYAVDFVFGTFKLGSIWFVINIGVILLLEMFDTLIVSIDYWDTVTYIEILLTGAVYLPYILICMTDKKENRSKFVRGFLLYVLMPLVLAAFAIIYLYIIRIIVTRRMPSNEVFRICAELFAIGVVIWTMADSYRSTGEEKESGRGRIYEKLIRNIKYMYAPFILLEGYAIGVRIAQYGVTRERYFAVIFILAQIIYIVWEPFLALMDRMKKKTSERAEAGYENMIFVGFILYIICFLAPGINADYVEYQSQKQIFESKMDEMLNYQANMDTFAQDYKKLRSIYHTLKYNVYGGEYLEALDSAEELEGLFDYNTQIEATLTGEKDVWQYVAVNCGDLVFDIAGYNKMYRADYSYTPELSCDDKLEITDKTGYLIISVEPEAIYEYFIQMDDEAYSRVPPYEVEVDGNHKLIIKYMRFRHSDKEDKIDKVKNIDIEGYILER